MENKLLFDKNLQEKAEEFVTACILDIYEGRFSSYDEYVRFITSIFEKKQRDAGLIINAPPLVVSEHIFNFIIERKFDKIEGHNIC